MSRIVWLASYPKSGNTWLRVFLANLNSDEPVGINALEGLPIASCRRMFDNTVGVEASDMTSDEIERIRPAVYEHVAAEANETLFLKVHDAFTATSEHAPLFPSAATRGAIYLVRNPLDVAVSFAHHNGVSIDETITRMADEGYCFCDKDDRLQNQLRQRLLSWSGHVLSWVDAPDIDLHCMRYEDMKRDTLAAFSAAATFCGMSGEPVAVGEALERCSFDELRRQELEQGFKERHPRAESFFRKGQAGSWRQALTADQVERIIDRHGEVMHRFEYLSDGGEILC